MLKTPFSLTFARLLADRGLGAVQVLATAILLAGFWIWWAARAQVTLYEISSAARVELDSATYPIQSPLLGRVVETKLRVGQTVKRGDVLVEIDTMPDRLRLSEQQVRLDGLEMEVARLRGQVTAEESARAEEQRTAEIAAEEAAGRIHEADTAAKYAEAELLRAQALAREGLAAGRDLQKAEAEARRFRAAVSTLQTAARRVPQEQATRDRERDVRLQRLYSGIAALESQRGTLRAGMEGLNYEIDRRRVRAPVDGSVGEAAILREGAVVQEGDKLGSIVPRGGLLIAAQFPSDAAFGRIRPGQRGVLRLDAFPWAEFGPVQARVARVAQEVRDGNARVELAIEPSRSFRGRLEHGMPGKLEVVVERLSPLSLILRTAGQWLTVHR